MWKYDIFWQVEQLHFRMRMVEEGEGGLAEIMGGGRVRYVMYLVCPQWQDPV
jgi:hypothetical protein